MIFISQKGGGGGSLYKSSSSLLLRSLTSSSSKPVISLTPKALQRLRFLSKAKQTPRIRLELETGGCAGIKYKFLFENVKETKSKDEIRIELEGEEEEDKIELLVSQKYLALIAGSKIDWKEDDMQAKFEFKNPNASNTCACGTSFKL